jgi:hypothetical protein
MKPNSPSTVIWNVRKHGLFDNIQWVNLCNHCSKLFHADGPGTKKSLIMYIDTELKKFNAHYSWDMSGDVIFDDESSLMHFLLTWS